ncbi:hypothetical protein BH11PSE12_BH11PSE12_05950 [soil metagenome]
MKPLEHRSWYVVLSLSVSALLVLGLWQVSALPLSLSAGSIFIFATVGVLQAINKLLALLLIKFIPSLGIVN